MPSDTQKSLDLPLCKACGGRCCQGSPGIWVDPERFFATFCDGTHLSLEQLRERLPEFGLVLWEKSGEPMPAPRSLDSGCSFLNASGCSLSVDKRPCQCLALIPVKETLKQPEGCLCRMPDMFTREQARQRWRNHWAGI